MAPLFAYLVEQDLERVLSGDSNEEIDSGQIKPFDFRG
jgi:hypothetical protein